MTEYINCSRCHMKFINDDEHIKTDFGYNRLNIRYKQCVRCRTKNTEYRNNNIEHARKMEKIYYENNKEKQKEYSKTYYDNHKEKVIAQQSEKIECSICKSLITRNKMNRHQQTDVCKKKALLLTNSGNNEKNTQLKEKQKEYCKRYYESNKDKVIAQQSEKIECNICKSLISRNKINRHQQTDICKKKASLLIDKVVLCVK